MKKATKYPLDLTHHGAIFTPNETKFDSLGELLVEVMEKGRINIKRQKVKIVIEKSAYNKDLDETYMHEVTKIFTVGHLRRVWEDKNGEIFSAERVKELNQWEMEMYEKNAQRRSAWSTYTQIMNIQRGLEDEPKFHKKTQAMNSDEKARAVKSRNEELSRKGHMLMIG